MVQVLILVLVLVSQVLVLVLVLVGSVLVNITVFYPYLQSTYVKKDLQQQG